MKHRLEPARNQQGAVALITAIIISILLLIIVTSIVTLMISELRQSSDSEQSIRAYYAAESGVEDAVAKLKLDPTLTQTNCGGNKNLNLDPANPGRVGWSCQIITSSGSPTGNLALPDVAVNIDLNATPNFDRVRVEWDQSFSPIPGYFDYGTPGFPTQAQAAGKAASVEATVIAYPNGTFFANDAGFKTINALFRPTSGAFAGGVNVNTAGTGPFTVANASCNYVGTYHCVAYLTDFPGNRTYYLRLRSRYSGTAYRLTFLNNVGAPVDVRDGTATIDVTGKAGDVYRRVLYKMPLSGGADVNLNYVLFTDGNVCKDLTIIGGAAQLGSVCP